MISNCPSVSTSLEDSVSKVYERTENDTMTAAGQAGGLAEAVAASMGEAKKIIDASEWDGTRTRPNHLHRFPTGERAACNRRFRPDIQPNGDGVWGPNFRTRADVQSGKYAHLYTFCPKCEAQ
ncbi:hypothetical protein ACFXPI_11065 [Streptomyces sp. NPDC059104]|uniref:hypothetical protein n=1 Tax=Streptomyces sp. NPDC059104 TaxID=3346729 RepID=UPI003678432E